MFLRCIKEIKIHSNNNNNSSVSNNMLFTKRRIRNQIKNEYEGSKEICCAPNKRVGKTKIKFKYIIYKYVVQLTNGGRVAKKAPIA